MNERSGHKCKRILVKAVGLRIENERPPRKWVNGSLFLQNNNRSLKGHPVHLDHVSLGEEVIMTPFIKASVSAGRNAPAAASATLLRVGVALLAARWRHRVHARRVGAVPPHQRMLLWTRGSHSVTQLCQGVFGHAGRSVHESVYVNRYVGGC